MIPVVRSAWAGAPLEGGGCKEFGGYSISKGPVDRHQLTPRDGIHGYSSSSAGLGALRPPTKYRTFLITPGAPAYAARSITRRRCSAGGQTHPTTGIRCNAHFCLCVYHRLIADGPLAGVTSPAWRPSSPPAPLKFRDDRRCRISGILSKLWVHVHWQWRTTFGVELFWHLLTDEVQLTGALIAITVHSACSSPSRQWPQPDSSSLAKCCST